jgi:surface antigen
MVRLLRRGLLLSAFILLGVVGFAAAGTQHHTGPAADLASPGFSATWTSHPGTVKAGSALRLTLDPRIASTCALSAFGPYEGQSVRWALKNSGLYQLRLTLHTNADATPGHWTLIASCHAGSVQAPAAKLGVQVLGATGGHRLIAESWALQVARIAPHVQTMTGVARRHAHTSTVHVHIGGGGHGAADPGDDYPAKWKNIPQDSVFDNWGEYNRECVSFVAWALSSRNQFNMPFYDNAINWGPRAQKLGFHVDHNPAIGSVAWSNVAPYGHVAYVVAVNGGSVTVEEYNYLHRGAYDTRSVAASAFTDYIHFKDIAAPVIVTPPPPPVTTTVVNTVTVAPPPATTTTAPPPPATTTTAPPPATTTTAPPPPATTTTAPPPPPQYFETTGGVTNTWTNYTNAGGNEGPQIGSNVTVQIACRLQGFTVADGNTWWYRVASSPWNSAYYASADAFYNNGQTSGSLHGTPFVDPNVPGC